jgi:hypothetical protein
VRDVRDAVAELKVARVSTYGRNQWAIVAPGGVPVEVPRVVVAEGGEPIRFMGAFFPRKRDALVALDILRIEARLVHEEG